MDKMSILNLKGEKVGTVELNENIWGIVPNDAVLYDALRLARNSRRQGTSDTKTRSEVSGGGRKPWRQKGTGRARQGSTRSPNWPGGGIVFGPHPRSYDKKMNRKERRLALKSALSYKVIDKELIVVDNFNLESSKTKDAIKVFNNLNVNGAIAVVVSELTDNVILATRNLDVMLMTVEEVNTFDVVAANKMIITEEALKKLEEVLI